MDYEIIGSTMPMLELKLSKEESIFAQTGAMQWMDAAIKMETEMKGGIFGAIKRSFSGEDMFVVNFSSEEEGAKVAFGHTYPGKIIPLDLSKGTIVCQQRSFLCAQNSVEYNLYFHQRLSSGFFGGEGFIMQKLSGSGMAFIEIDGECVEKELKEGERIKVDTGSVGAFEETVSMNIELVKGFKNMFFGGEGMFLTTLTGPGKVWIQTMPIQCMVGEIYNYMPKPKSN